MKKTKNFLFFTIVVVFVFFVLLSTFFLLKNQTRLSTGQLKIFDDKNQLIAQFCESENKLECFYEGSEDYIENVLEEALTIINETCSVSYDKEKFMRCNIKIHTSFSVDCFNNLKKAFLSFSYEDEKATEAAIVTSNGKLIASIGKQGLENKVVAPHKAGSAIKPLSVYAPAFEQNIINWATSVEDSPFKKLKINNEVRNWPLNYEGTYSYKKQSLKHSVAKSLNTVATKVLDELTPKESCRFLEEIGILVPYEKEIAQRGNYADVYGNLALGELKGGITTEKLAAAYQIFANGGNYTKLYCIIGISDNEKEIYTAKPTAKRVLSASNAEIMSLLLKEVVSDNGTAKKAKVENLNIAGKTGTSQGYKDNWFVGFTPDYICSVWYGYDKALVKRGENEALMVFKEIITRLDVKKSDFPKSEDSVTAEYCVSSEMLAKEGCNKTEMGYFDKNNMPKKCTRH